MSTLEHVRDSRTGEIISVERLKCGICGFLVENPKGHSECRRQAREREAYASMEWNRKQELQIQQMFEQTKVKSQQELDHEEFVAETDRVQEKMKLEQRKKHLADLESEAQYLRQIISKEEL
jgi:hypothetical protein